MDEHIERYEPTPEDLKLFDGLIAYVCANHEKFREAGRWLDASYGRGSEPWKKAISESIRALKAKHLPEGDLTQGHFAYFRFKTAWNGILPEVSRLSVLKRQERLPVAARYLLLVWLLVDPDADDLQPMLTEFQQWDWNPADSDPAEDDELPEMYIPDDRDDSHYSRTYARKRLVDKDTASLVRYTLSSLGFKENADDPFEESRASSYGSDKVLITAQIAERAGCSTDTVLNAIANGHLAAIKPAKCGGRASYSAWQSDVDRWIKAGKPAGKS